MDATVNIKLTVAELDTLRTAVDDALVAYAALINDTDLSLRDRDAARTRSAKAVALRTALTK